MTAKDDTPTTWELELDHEEIRVRKWREARLYKAGFNDFAAFRLSMVPEWRRAIELLEAGATEEFVIDQLID